MTPSVAAILTQKTENVMGHSSVHHDKKWPFCSGKLAAFQCSVWCKTPLPKIQDSVSYKLHPAAPNSTRSNLRPNLWLLIIHNSQCFAEINSFTSALTLRRLKPHWLMQPNKMQGSGTNKDQPHTSTSFLSDQALKKKYKFNAVTNRKDTDIRSKWS